MNEIFDTSAISTDRHITKDELVKEMLVKLDIILKREFPNNPQRQKVKVHKDRLSFAAPCCGDSATDNSKKRGNIILEGKFKNMYKCHNCGVCMSVNNFFKKYGQNLSFEAISYIVDNSAELSYGGNFIAFAESIYNVKEAEEYAVDREWFKQAYNLQECNAGGKAYSYLVSRKQYSFGKFLYSPTHELLFVLNLTPNGKILGMQVRHMAANYKGPKYKTYSLSKIYQTFLKSSYAIPDEVDTISMIFNILLIDYSRDVIVMEGPMDSFLVPNAIALCGAGKHITFPFKCRYLFDSDKEGRKHAIEYVNGGNEVFLWERYKYDNHMPDRPKWDINDAFIWAEKNNVKLKKLDDYFSDDTLDIIDI
jgi:hypothetical protein